MHWDGDAYQRRFDALAESGADVHGEADFVEHLNPTSVLDAGCGTGRVARELARRGIDVVGLDRDESMIAAARRLAPALNWLVGDLTQFDLGRVFDVVLMAGNVPLFTPRGTQAGLVSGCATHLAAGGRLVAGFQLDHRYPLADYDQHCRNVGLRCTGRWSTWSREPYTGESDYVVAIHQPTL